MILESIVTTVSSSGEINLAPMGPLVEHPAAMSSLEAADPHFVLRPFEGSRTYENLDATRRATIHVTDDVALFAAGAIGHPVDVADRVRRSACGRFAILDRCHRWFAVEIHSATETPPRHEMKCRVVDSAIEAPFFGFNRAKHAVIEAAILATRTHLLDEEQIRSELEALKPLVEKTAGDSEREAFEMLIREIGKRLKHSSPDGVS